MSARVRRRSRPSFRSVGAATIATLTCVLTGCGGATERSTPTTDRLVQASPSPATTVVVTTAVMTTVAVTSTSAAPTVPPPTIPPPTVPPPPVDPCSLVTQAEAEMLAERDVQLPVASGLGSDSPLCMFATQVSGPIAQVEVFVGPGALKYLEIDRDVLGHEFSEVAGVGDEAHLEDGAIFFRVGDTWAALRVTRLADDPTEADRLQELARTVASRL